MCSPHVKTAFLFATLYFNFKMCVLYGINSTHLPMFCVRDKQLETCHSTDQNPYRHFGTKTRYDIGTINITEHNIDKEGCKPVLFYLLCRHGTRLPITAEMTNMEERIDRLKKKVIRQYEAGNSSLCEQDIKRLRPWTFSLNPRQQASISENGIRETRRLARRQKAAFPELLDHKYSDSHFLFEYSSSTRALKTGQAYAVGLFGPKGDDVPLNLNDPALKFFEPCSDYQDSCNITLRDESETAMFKSGPFHRRIQHTVSQRIGFHVGRDDVNAMLDACRYAYALDGDDVWCSVFTPMELKVLHYTEDLRHYYADGYGNKINYEQACPVVQFVVNAFRNATTGKPFPKAIFQFSQSSAIKKVFPRFGLFQDEEPLTSSNMCYMDNRKWDSARFCPFITNLALVLYQCDGEYKILGLHNEEPIQIGGCSELFCPLEEFYSTYDEISDNCDLKRLCCPCCTD